MNRTTHMWRYMISRRKLLRLTLVAGGAALLGNSGCDQFSSNRQSAPKAKTAVPAEKLRVLVVDDPDLGQAIQGEWHSRTEGDVEIVPAALKDVTEASRLPGDIVVFPAALLGSFVERDLIRPISETLLASESLAVQDVFPLTRLHEITWREKIVYALPLGSPQLVLAYRPDLLQRLELAAPVTWDEYQAAVAKLSDRALLADGAPAADQPWRAAAEPAGPGWGGSLLLARGAAYASHREQRSPLFDWPNLEPLIDRPPYVRALEELAASAKAGGQGPIASPADAWTELLAGRCAMAFTWPAGNAPAADAKTTPLAFAEMPGSPHVYNFRQNRWENRGAQEDRRVPLLGMAGRLVAVTANTSQSSAAEGLAGWLAGSEVSSRAASRSRSTTLFRASHRSALDRWAGGLPETAASQYFEVVQQSQSHAQWLSTIRLPGSQRYLAALDQAVHRAVVDGKDPEAALHEAAAEWRTITAELGAAAQRAALSHSLGLESD